jgi:imidazolonepropionase-like amidohydrolase
LIEGRGVTVKTVPARTAQEMMFPDAPHTVKLACGENPRNGNGYPNTKMGNVAGYRAAFIEAQGYRDQWDAWLANPVGPAPDRDLGLETLAEVLRGNILVQWHCYTADEMATNLEVAREFQFPVRSFHHAVEAYKIADLLAEAGASASMWSENWGFKMEGLDGIPENVALVSAAGARAIVHSDDDMRTQYMNHEAAKSMWAARRAGMDVSRDEALRWVTANPAWALGLSDRIGTLEVGKNADVVLWSGDPLSVYSLADEVWIDGAVRWDRDDPDLQPISDFELGMPPTTAEAISDMAPTTTSAVLYEPPELDLPLPSSGPVAILGGTVHPVSGDPIANGAVLIRDGRIEAVGPAASVSVPDNARRIDATGRVVTPGFFDAGTQIGLVEVNSIPGTRDESLDAGANRAAFRASDGLNARSMAVPVVRREGVTTVISSPTGGVISGQSVALDLAGSSRHEMIVRDPAGVSVTLGPGAAGSAGDARGGVVLELRDALDAAQEALDEASNPNAADAFDRETAPLVAVLRGRLPLVVRASGAGDIEMALDLQTEYGFRMVIDGGEEAWMVAPALAARGVPVMVRALENRPTQFDRLGTRYDGPALLEQAGVPVILTTRSTHSAGQLPHHGGNAVRYGLSRDEALRAVTLHPAQAFGMDSAYGTLAPGSVANVVIWSGDPFEFSGFAETVFIRGQETDMDSRQRRLFERYRTLDGETGYRRD